MSVVWIVLAVAVAMIACELRTPGRDFAKVRGWWTRAIFLNGMQVLAVWVAGNVWDGWLLRHRLWDADGLGVLGGSIVGYLAITFVYYWWHRWRHSSHLLWRVFHQVHHSASRIEIITAFYKHPVEVFANGLISSLILYQGVGLSAEAAMGAVLLSGLAELFYHWNVRTPYWVGFLFQRPESHCVHHKRGVHTNNFGDLPLWDILFGTFHNPRQFTAKCGFEPEQELRLGAMLLTRDVARASSGASR